MALLAFAHSKELHLAWGYADTISILVMGRRAWSDSDWREYIVNSTEMTIKYGPRRRNLLFASTVVPTTSQRNEAVAYAKQKKIEIGGRVATLSDSTVLRVATNAFATLMTLNKSDLVAKAFSPHTYRAAGAWFEEDNKSPEKIDEWPEMLRKLMPLAGYLPADMAFLETQGSAGLPSG